MARLVKLEANAPAEIKIANESKWICMCGLSGNAPFCSGAHKQTSDEAEGKLYKYEKEKRVEVEGF